MNSPWSNVVVVALWLTTMSWLVAAKILPSLVAGDPPDRAAMMAAQSEDGVIGYDVRWEDGSIGWAVIQTERTASGATLIDGRIVFEHLPIRSMVPEIFLKMFDTNDALLSHMHLNAKSKVRFHANGQLQRFESTLSCDPVAPAIRVDGFTAGDVLVVKIRSSGSTHEMHRPLPRNAVVSNAMMPQTRIPGLYEGRKWTAEVFSPLRPSTDPFEIVQAEVVGREPIAWGGHVENTWLVIYRGDPGGNISHAGKERAWLWVRDDGVVLQHRISVLQGAVTFVRMPDAKSRELEKRLEQEASPDQFGEGEPDETISAGRGAHSETDTEVLQR